MLHVIECTDMIGSLMRLVFYSKEKTHISHSGILHRLQYHPFEDHCHRLLDHKRQVRIHRLIFQLISFEPKPQNHHDSNN